MKKILGFILALCLGISSADLAWASEITSMENVPESIELLQFLNIVEEDYNDINFNQEQTVTRADFAVYFQKLLNKTGESGSELYYNDVSKNHYAYKAITNMTELGYLSGVGEKRFAPDDIMQTEHAVSAVLKAMGYGVYLENNSVWAAASNAKIIKGVNSGSGDLTLGSLFNLMYNALLAECMEVKTFSTVNMEYAKGDTLLYNTRKMQYVKNGKLTGAYGVSITDETLGEDEAIIDGYVYKTDMTDLFEYIGYNIKFIYQEDGKDDEDELIWIKPNNNDDILKITADEDCSFDKSSWTFKYYDERDRQKTVKLSQNITVIYNGAVLTDSVSKAFEHEKYDVTFISDNSSYYNLAVVWAYENILVSGKDTKDMLVFDKKTGASFNLDEDDYDRFELVSSVGDKVKFTEIKDNDVISIYASDKQEAMKAIVNTKVVSGDIVSRDKDNGISVDGEWYESYIKSEFDNLGDAKSITLYLDFKGYSAYCKTSFLDKNSFIAYVIRAAYEQDGDCLKFKIFDEKGNYKIVSSENKVSIDDKKYYADEDTVSTVFTQTNINGETVFKPQLMLFKQNSDGVIKKIYRATDENGTTKALIKDQTLTASTKYFAVARAAQGIIGLNVLYDNNTKVLTVPEDAEVRSADAEKFSVGLPADGKGYQNAVTYKVTTDDVFYAQYILYKSKIQIDIAEHPQFFVIDSFSTALNKDDEVVQQVSGFLGGAERTYALNYDYGMSQGIGSANKGDIYLISTNEDGEIVNNRRVYKNDDDNYTLDYYGAEANDYGEAKTRFYIGRVTAKEGSALKIERYYEGETFAQVANLKSGSGAIVICDNDSKHLYKGGIDDVNVGSLLIVNTTYNSNASVTVYKNK